MPNYPGSLSLLSRIPIVTFERLQSVFVQMAKSLEGATILTENILEPLENFSELPREHFTALISERFSGLLLGETNYSTQSDPSDSLSMMQIRLTFEPKAIATFLNQLVPRLKHNPQTCSFLKQASLSIKPNDATIQSEFTLLLIEIISDRSEQQFSVKPSLSSIPAYQPVETGLHQQVEQERLLNQIATQIRNSLELPVILTTAVERVQQLLQADRVVIYQFDSEPRQESKLAHQNYAGELNGKLPNTITENNSTKKIISGSISYEGRSSDAILSVLNLAEATNCPSDVLQWSEKYRQGLVLAVEDVEKYYSFSPCLIDLMRQTQVRAKLVVPIVVQEKLWGLLIAHQCHKPRQWEDREKTFLKHIAEDLAIAIYQGQLYAELQQQKFTLEKRVNERTQELYDALVAAQAANQAKSEFLATISHELRTPLTSVIGLSSTLLHWGFDRVDGLDEANPPTVSIQKQRKYLQTIHDSGEHLLELINDILDLSQVQAGKAVLNLSKLSLIKLATESLESLEEKATLKGVNLAIELPNKVAEIRSKTSNLNLVSADLNSFIADEERLRQILFNLLSNAIKFTPSGGQITLRVWVEVDTAAFEVEDTGIGIPEHQLPLIFEKFQQLEPSYQRTYEGLGLGLALTKHLVELHGGRIEVESTVGGGSTFTVWLPTQPTSASTEITETETRISSLINPLGIIVLVQDDEEIATLICDILTATGYQVVWLMQSSSALTQIKLLQPKAIIVDMRSPSLDNYEFLNSMRGSKTTRKIKILVLIAIEIPKNIQRSIIAISDDYLIGTLRPDNLLYKIADLVGN